MRIPNPSKIILFATLYGCGVTGFNHEGKSLYQPEDIFDCSASREFITTYRYLRHPETNLGHKAAVKLAHEVSAGCDQAASRFIQISEIVRNSGLGARDAFAMAKPFAITTPIKTKAFVTIFKSAYLKKGLDLTLQDALNIALALSIEYEGDPHQALEDYHGIVEYCLDPGELAMPRANCAKLAKDITIFGEKSNLHTLEPFKDMMEFARDEDGPKIPTFQAIKLSKELMEVSPVAVYNFMEAYRFLTDEHEFKRKPAIAHARRVAHKTFKKASGMFKSLA